MKKLKLSSIKFQSRMLYRAFFFSLILLNVRSYSQMRTVGSPSSVVMNIADLMERINTTWITSNRVETIKGSPYLSYEFQTGKIIMKDSTVFNDIPIRYNIYNDDLEFTYKGKEYAIGAKDLLHKVVVGDDVFVVEKYESGARESYGYFLLLAEGKANLLKKLEIELTDPVPAKPMRDPEPRKFVRKTDTYYIKSGDQSTYEISKLKKLIAFLGNHQEEMSRFAKENKISIKDQDDLTEFIAYYNTL